MRAYRRLVIWAACEGWALGQLLLGCWSPKVALVAALKQNQISAAQRLWWAGLPCVLALCVGGAVAWFGRRESARAALTPSIQLATPLLGLWLLPSLWARAAFLGQDLIFMLLVAVFAGLMEWSLGVVLVVEQGRRWGRRLREALQRPALVWPTMAAVGTVAFCLFAAHGSVRVHHKMLTSTFDLGIFENLFHNTLAGKHGFAAGIPYFGQHLPLLLYVLLPVYALFPAPETLLWVQAVLTSAAAVPLYILARHYFGDRWPATALVAVYLLYPAIHGPVFFDFHFLTFSSVFILTAACGLVKRRWGVFWVGVVLAAACREDVALGMAVVAVLALAAGWPRPKVALGVAGLGATVFAVLKFGIMQRYLKAPFAVYYADLLPEGERGMLGVAQTLVSNPVYVLQSLVRGEKLRLALQLLAPLAFLPVRRLGLLPLLGAGFLVVGLATSRGAILQTSFHYVSHFVPYLFCGAVWMLAVQPRARREAQLVAALLTSLVCSHQHGAFFVDSFATSFHEVSFDWTPEDEARRQAFTELAERIPSAASVSAGEHEGPHLAARERLVSLKSGPRECDYVITSKRSLRWGGTKHLRAVLRSGEYGVIGLQGEHLLLQRGAGTERNREGLRYLR